MSAGRRVTQVANEATCDQILAILRDASEPMIASEIGQRLACTFVESCRDRERCRVGTPGQDLHWHYLAHENGQDIFSRVGLGAGPATRSLPMLLRRGLVERERRGHSVYWSLAGSREDDEHDAAIWDLEAALML